MWKECLQQSFEIWWFGPLIINWPPCVHPNIQGLIEHLHLIGTYVVSLVVKDGHQIDTGSAILWAVSGEEGEVFGNKPTGIL